VIEALNLFLMLHADHEQNCSTSHRADGGLFPGEPLRFRLRRHQRPVGTLHGGANKEVIRMLKAIYDGKTTVDE
jgi:citrate synthase